MIPLFNIMFIPEQTSFTCKKALTFLPSPCIVTGLSSNNKVINRIII